MLHRPLIMLSALLVCSTAGAAEEPQWLKDARAREGKPAKVATVKDAEGFFSIEVPAKLTGKVVQSDGNYTMQLDMGSEYPMTCEVIKEGFDLAGLLRIVANNTFDEASKLQGKIEAKFLEQQDAGAIAASPFVVLEWIYRVNNGKEARLGALKQFAATKGGHGLYCSHLELGYTKTFRNVAAAFVESAKFSTASPEPQYREISTAWLGTRPVGVAISSVSKDAEGDHRLTNSMSLLLPITQDTLLAQDSYHIAWSDADGELINGVHVISSNGEIDTNVALKPSEDGPWIVEGVFKQKEIKQTLDAEQVPLTWMQQALARRALFGQAEVVGKTLKELVWTAANPTAFVESTMTVTGAADAGTLAVRDEVAGIVADSVIDRATGLPLTMTIPMGQQSLVLKRVYAQGSF